MSRRKDRWAPPARGGKSPTQPIPVTDLYPNPLPPPRPAPTRQTILDDLQAAFVSLSEAELQVARLWLYGRTPEEIAHFLEMDRQTVRKVWRHAPEGSGGHLDRNPRQCWGSGRRIQGEFGPALSNVVLLAIAGALCKHCQQFVRAGFREGRIVDVPVEFDQLHARREPVADALEQSRVRLGPPERLALGVDGRDAPQRQHHRGRTARRRSPSRRSPCRAGPSPPGVVRISVTVGLCW